MPYMHNENQVSQNTSCALFELLAESHDEDSVEKNYFENGSVMSMEHRDVVEKFGRFPGRNLIWRESMPEEIPRRGCCKAI